MTTERTLLQASKAPISLDIEGSRVLFWPTADDGQQTPTASLVFIVGNPGLADYYVNYLTELQRLVHSDGRASLEVFCVAQQGHDPHALSRPTGPISLDEQIDAKADVLFAISKRWTGARHPKLLLSGHSIGAYMALELVRRRLTPTPVTAVHLLFPTLHQIGQSPNARRLAWLLKADDRPTLSRYVPSLLVLLTFVISVVLRVVQCLPLPIVHFLILCVSPSQPYDAIRTTSDFVLDPACVQQALHMARDEMQLVKEVQTLDDAADADTAMRNGNGVSATQSRIAGRDAGGVKLRAYWSAGDLDGWAPEATRNVVEDALGLKTYELPADITDKHRSVEAQKSGRKKRAYTIDEIRQARQGGKRRVLAGMVHAGASAGYTMASTIGNLGHRRRRRRPAAGPPPARSSGSMRGGGGGGGFQPSPHGSPVRTIKRRPSLLAATASRRFDGTIVIEPAPAQNTDDEELDLLSADVDPSAEGLMFSPAATEPTLHEAWNGSNVSDVPALRRPESVNAALRMPDRASIVCKLGMPHAFVLSHSEKMAAISSAMLLADILPE